VGVLTTVPELNTGNPYGPVCQYDTTRRTKKRRTKRKKVHRNYPASISGKQPVWKSLSRLLAYRYLSQLVCVVRCAVLCQLRRRFIPSHTPLSHPPSLGAGVPGSHCRPQRHQPLSGAVSPISVPPPLEYHAVIFDNHGAHLGKQKKTNTAALVQTSLRRFLGASLRLCASSQTNIPTCLQLWISLSRILSTRVRGQEASFGG